jgi:topoisomerase-4 subunit B
LKARFKSNQKVEVSRFKGLGEMPPAALKETTMDPKKRTLLRVMLTPEDRSFTSERVEELMGRRPELRFRFIQENAGRIAAEALVEVGTVNRQTEQDNETQTRTGSLTPAPIAVD